jgi:hypothetical protein
MPKAKRWKLSIRKVPTMVWVFVLIVSLTANIGLISLGVIMNSRLGTYMLYNLAYDHLCVRDYSWLSGNITDTNAKIYLKELNCGIGVNSSIKNGHVVLTPAQ